MQDTGCLGLVHWDDPEGWYGEGGVRGVQDISIKLEGAGNVDFFPLQICVTF